MDIETLQKQNADLLLALQNVAAGRAEAIDQLKLAHSHLAKAGEYESDAIDTYKLACGTAASDIEGFLEDLAARTPAANAGDPAEKGLYWFSCLVKCARLLGLTDDEPIPAGVVAAVEKLTSSPAAEKAGDLLGELRSRFASLPGSAKNIRLPLELLDQICHVLDGGQTDAMRVEIERLRAKALDDEAKHAELLATFNREIGGDVFMGEPAIPRPAASGGAVLRSQDQCDEAIRICNAMTDEIGDRADHPLFPMTLELMNAIGAWEGSPAAVGAGDLLPLTDAAVRSIFLAKGFTIKEGQADLKPYVFDAAHALMDAMMAQRPHAVDAVDLSAWPEEPTPEMQQAGATAIRFDTTIINKLWTANAVYRAMRAAVKGGA